MDEADWGRLIAQLRNGDCTPVLGAGAVAGVLPTGGDLARQWAAGYDYPFADVHDLPRVMQYAATVVRDPVYLKQLFSQELEAYGPPDFDDPADLHALLAEMPLPVYLTTNFDDSMAQALVRAGKQPHVGVSPWYDQNSGPPPLDEPPSPERPLVFHLNGRIAEPESLVLTEDDYFEQLVAVARDWETGSNRLIPVPVMHALSSTALLFVGLDPRTPQFRVLYHGILRDVPGVRRRRHVSILLPPVTAQESGKAERARDFLQRNLEEWRISVYWGTPRKFFTELRRRMGATP